MKDLHVKAIENGTVLDHIPPSKLFKVAELMGCQSLDTTVVIGNNFHSTRSGKKGVIRVSDKFFSQEEINRMAILAPEMTLNIIRNFKVISKSIVRIPNEIIGLVRCPNPKCITRNEPMPSHFLYSGEQGDGIACKYCGRKVNEEEIELI